MKRVMWWAGGVLALLVIGFVGLVLYFRRSLPLLSGQVTVAGLSRPVEIVRDRYAVPHIDARTAAEASFGLGYAHAQDRLWQLELNRRLGSGTLSEVFGEKTIGEDRLLRTVGMRRVAEANLAYLDTEMRAVLDAYARGVNAYVQDNRRRLPPEFVMLGVEPGVWTPVDSVLCVKVMAWTLSENWKGELLRLRLGRTLTPKQVSEFWGGDPLPASNFRELYGSLGPAAEVLIVARPSKRSRASVGSNNWAVDGSRTLTGKPLLANDPHLGLTVPSIWYLAHLRAPDLNVIGATLPGVPTVILGRNDRVAWAFTNTQSDTQDLFIEKLDPSDPSRYFTPSGTERFVTRREGIKVRGAPDEVLEIRVSRHGPVISDAYPKSKDLMPKGYVMALRWASLEPEDQTLRFTIKAARSTNSDELFEATRDFHSPQQNIVYADDSGSIGFIAAGRMPMRGADNEIKGLVPAPGWLGKYDWTGFVPFEELPQLRQPASGRIVTANQDIRPPGYRHWVGSDWSSPKRSERIGALLDATAKHSVQSFEAIQMDVRSGVADALLSLLLQTPASSAEERNALERLRGWNLEMRPELPEPLIFAAWVRELSRRIYADEIGDMFPRVWNDTPEFLRDVLSNREGKARWCDDVQTAPVESCQQIIAGALHSALAYLSKTYGSDSSNWSWGRVHQIHSTHAPFGSVPVLRNWFDVVVTGGGDNQTVNVGGYSLNDEEELFTVREGPGLRAIYDLSEPERSMFILSTGQSGHPLSPYYRDWSKTWARGGYVPMVTRRAVIERDSIGTLVLRPKY